MTDLRRVTRALISVSDKTGARRFRARALAGHRRRARFRPAAPPRRSEADAGLKVIGRLRTDRLSRDDGRPRQDAASQGARRPAGDPRQQRNTRRAMRRTPSGRSICLVVNLYPFEATVAKDAAYDDCIENIDIGGPAMIRAAAKNHADVAVVVEPDGLRRAARGICRHHGGATTLALRKKLAAKAYARTAAYDAAISNWFANELGDPAPAYPRASAASSPRRCATARTRTRARRSTARPRRASASPPRARCRASSSPTTTSTTPTRPTECVAEFDPDAHRRLRHHQARQSVRRCRKARASSTPTARRSPAIRSSAFGGIVALNRTLDAEAARADHRDLHRGDHRAGRDRGSASRSSAPKKNLRLLLAGGLPDPRACGLTGEDRSPAVCWCNRATTPWSTTCSSRPSPSARRPSSRACRSALCVPRRQARQVEHHRLRQGSRHRRHRRRTDEPRRFRAHRRAQGRGCRQSELA